MASIDIDTLPLPPVSLRTRNLLLSGLIFVVISLVILVALPPLINARDTALQGDLDNVQAFTEVLIDTENSLMQMQADTRGYLLTQSSAFLRQYRATETNLPAQLTQLSTLGKQVDPGLVLQLDLLQSTVGYWQLEGSRYQIALVEQGRLSGATAELAVGQSQSRFDAIRNRIRDLHLRAQANRSTLQSQLSDIHALQRFITFALGLLGLVSLGFIVAIFWRMINLMQHVASERSRTAVLADQLHAQLATADRQNRQLTVFHAIATASAISLQPAQRTRYVLATIARALDLPAGGAWIVYATEESARASGYALYHDIVADHVAILHVLERGQSLLFSDTRTGTLDPDLAPLLAHLSTDVQSVIMLPLRNRTQLIGSLVLASAQPGYFVEHDLDFYEILAGEVGALIDNAQLYAKAQTEHQRLLAIFNHSPEGIIVAETPDGRIVLANATVQALIGEIQLPTTIYNQLLPERVYRPNGQILPKEDLPLVATLRDGSTHRGVELVLAAPDGARIPVLVTSVPLFDDDGALIGGVAVFQDLRQLREVERLKSDFVGLVSHELRTPLTAIKGCTESLLRGSAESNSMRAREFLHIIDEQSDRLQELIENLLNLSQIEAGSLRLRRTLVVLPLLINEVLHQVRESAIGLRIQAELSPNLPPIHADPRRIEQVLFNLLDNARKWNPSNGVITVAAAPENDMIRVAVRDQGPGIPVAERKRVFERFYQIAHAHTPQTGGSGLGLAICKMLVEAHSGQIDIADAPGGGAEVWFTIPALPEAEANELPLRADVGVRGTRVLVIDDDLALRRMLERGLTDVGYIVQTVIESQAALDAMTEYPPDIVLLDLQLPGVDGFELCRQLRQWTKVPIIILTARAAEQDVVHGFQVGADDYLTKPFYMRELVARMEVVLRRASPLMLAGGVSYIQIDGLTVDLAQRRVTVEGIDVRLTPTEYSILAILAQHIGQVLTHEQILKAVWSDTHGSENNYLWVHIAHVRQKIEQDPKQPRYILTERGIGYQLVKAAAQST